MTMDCCKVIVTQALKAVWFAAIFRFSPYIVNTHTRGRSRLGSLEQQASAPAKLLRQAA